MEEKFRLLTGKQIPSNDRFGLPQSHVPHNQVTTGQLGAQGSSGYHNSRPTNPSNQTCPPSFHPEPSHETPTPLMQSLISPPAQVQAINLLQNILSHMMITGQCNGQLMQPITRP